MIHPRERYVDFLLAEHRAAVDLTFHVDELRNRLSTLFVTIVGAIGVAVEVLGDTPRSDETLLAWLFAGAAVAGSVIVCILGRLRRVQLEHFAIINNIRSLFVGPDLKVWNVVQLSRQTLRTSEKLGSGTYFWVLLVILASSAAATVSVYRFCAHAGISVVIGVLMTLLLHFFYFELVGKIEPRVYTPDNPPWKAPA
ncbi:MAG TPA: hypothetical protein VG318_05190 [Actinomycetota bacterium]|nr:hypothetical protein [Actinomycetota bacterium]